jgi:hypothetical protein
MAALSGSGESWFEPRRGNQGCQQATLSFSRARRRPLRVLRSSAAGAMPTATAVGSFFGAHPRCSACRAMCAAGVSAVEFGVTRPTICLTPKPTGWPRARHTRCLTCAGHRTVGRSVYRFGRFGIKQSMASRGRRVSLASSGGGGGPAPASPGSPGMPTNADHFARAERSLIIKLRGSNGQRRMRAL